MCMLSTMLPNSCFFALCLWVSVDTCEVIYLIWKIYAGVQGTARSWRIYSNKSMTAAEQGYKSNQILIMTVELGDLGKHADTLKPVHLDRSLCLKTQKQTVITVMTLGTALYLFNFIFIHSLINNCLNDFFSTDTFINLFLFRSPWTSFFVGFFVSIVTTANVGLTVFLWYIFVSSYVSTYRSWLKHSYLQNTDPYR